MARKYKAIPCIVIVVVAVILFFVFFKFPLNESRPVGTSISSGSFRELSPARELDCEGNVELIETNEGNHVLYFYDVYMRPPAFVNIYISDQTSFNTQLADFGTYVDLGATPTDSGSFSVSIPDNVDVSIYNTVFFANPMSRSIVCWAPLD